MHIRDRIGALPLRTRLIIIVAAAHVLPFALSIVLATRPAPVKSLPLLAGLGLALAVSGSLAIIRIVNATQRLNDMTRHLEQQVTIGNVAALLPVGRADEIGKLAEALNLLISASRAALQRMHAHADDLTMLNTLAATISQTLDLQQVLDTSLKETLNAIGWEAGAIYMWDQRTRSFNMVSYQGLSEDYIRDAFSYAQGEGPIGKAAMQREPVIWEPGVGENPHDEVATQINIPLRVPNSLLGVLGLTSRTRRELKPGHLELLTTIAHQVATALEKAQLHSDLTTHAQELEGVVAARTEALAQAIDELSGALEQAREADKVKSQLLSVVSHELRTPLATIKGHTSMLVDHYQQVTPDMLKQSLTDIEEEADKLTELISNLLEMSRIEAGVLHIQPQDHNLLDTVRSTVDAARFRLAHNPVYLEAPQGRVQVYADARRVQQIIDNLLDNAAKHSVADGAIYVAIEAEKTHVTVKVRDEGPGISPEHIDHIFDRFYQTGTDTDRSRGIGLGLAICRGLVEAHGGRIWVESEKGKGSTFFFTLPEKSAAEKEEPSYESKSAARIIEN